MSASEAWPQDHLPQDELFKKVQAGDWVAASGLYECYRDFCLRVVRGLLSATIRRVGESADVLQCTHLRILSGALQGKVFASLKDFVAFVARITANETLRMISFAHAQKRDIRRRSSQDLDTLADQHSRPDADAVIHEALQRTDLDQELLHLFLGGKTTEEVAIHLNVSVRTVQRRLEQLEQALGS